MIEPQAPKHLVGNGDDGDPPRAPSLAALAAAPGQLPVSASGRARGVRSYALSQLALSDLVGIGALQLAALLLVVADSRWALVPLGLYLLSCAIAPFHPRLGYFLPILSRARRDTAMVALTFDDGPDPAVTPRLLDLLDQRQTPATFFLVGDRAGDAPQTVRDIVARGHEVGNHSQTHDHLLSLRGRGRIASEVKRCQDSLAQLGVRPRVFRPPVGITSPRLRPALGTEGLVCVNFSVRAGDGGQRGAAGLAERVLGRVRGGDIVALHDRRAPADREVWLREVGALLDGLRARGLRPVGLSELLRRPVSEIPGPPTGPVRDAYDALAIDYDDEAVRGSRKRLRRIEAAVIASRLPTLPVSGRVLELGAGTGRYTLELARRAREVVALDLSDRMLAQLESKRRAAGIENIQAVHGDMTTTEVAGTFDLICSFSAIEYVPDLSALFAKWVPQLRDGGAMYCITAHASLLRRLEQIRYSLRHGIRLHARRPSDLRRALTEAGLQPQVERAHGMFWPAHRLLLEALASKAPSSGPATRREHG